MDNPEIADLLCALYVFYVCSLTEQNIWINTSISLLYPLPTPQKVIVEIYD